jgi:hypothetical protein
VKEGFAFNACLMVTLLGGTLSVSLAPGKFCSKKDYIKDKELLFLYILSIYLFITF